MASQEERDRILAEYMASVENDDDDDDEGEFEPTGNDDDDDSSSDEKEPANDGIVLTGSLGMRDDRLVYSGTWRPTTDNQEKKFKLKSKPQKLPLHWDASCPTVSDPSKKEIPRMRTLVFDGFFIATDGSKMKERDVNMTFSVKQQDENSSRINGKSYKNDDEEDGKPPAAKRYKTDPDEDSKMPSKPAANSKEDGKMPADSKASPHKTNGNSNNSPTEIECGVFGRGTNDYGNFEFESISWNDTSGELVCRKHYVQSKGAASAAAAAASSDDEDGEADYEVDYDELIALHQDAGLPVEELRRRYHENGGGASVHAGGNKRQRVEESDEEEFDGF